MKHLLPLFVFILILTACSVDSNPRVIEDFNHNWSFHLGDVQDAALPAFDHSKWKILSVPHDWSIEEGYQREGTGASTGFVPGGIGWYRKSFKLSPADEGKQISIVFDGVYNNSSVWINGHLLGYRPNGYSTFSYDLSKYLHYTDSENIIAVKVDRRTYIDSRWYTGSGIYRKVQLVKKAPLHIAKWGTQITTTEVNDQEAKIRIRTKLEDSGASSTENLSLKFEIISWDGIIVSSEEKDIAFTENEWTNIDLSIKAPSLWSVDVPRQYKLKTSLIQNDVLLDKSSDAFGIRTFHFDANEGFSLNGKRMKIKGVNLHHDAGALGAAVPKAIWEYRIDKLKSIGVNAVRLSHNPHAVELLEVCDEKGMLVMDEAFDEWTIPKGKSLVFLGDGAAPKEAARSYTESFPEWAERDLKDLILRDFNHPSVIMWSIGNEIEWTFPHYSKTYSDVNGANKKYFKHKPIYDSLTIKTAFDKNVEGLDSLAIIAKQLSTWVKETDTTRPVISGSVHPSIACASGYAAALDILGFNYRAVEYDAAHETYPNMIILGSENWGAWSEWKNCIERDFVAGIFAWTGFAYLGEAGPWPRKGLEISFFDYAGFKTPRGHFFECLWVDEAKTYLVTSPAKGSEYSYSEAEGWDFEFKLYEKPRWPELRLWEWNEVYPKWDYSNGEPVIVQAYTNCEEAELFLNGKSLGKQKRSDFQDDNVIKWMVPYAKGELKVIGYNKGVKASEYDLKTAKKLKTIVLNTNKAELRADGYDVAVVTVELHDEDGVIITTNDMEIEFNLTGVAKNIGIDNGWENFVGSHRGNKIKTHFGKAIIHIQSTKDLGKIEVQAKTKDIQSEILNILAI